MAIFHLTTKVFSRGKGQSAIAAAAYRSGDRLIDEATGEQKFYTARSSRIAFEGLFVPTDAPDWTRDRNAFWNRAEQTEPRKDARLAREIELALPHELTDQQREYLVKDFVRETFVRRGYAVDVAIHAPDRQSDARNHHAHILIAERRVGPDGFADRKDPAMNSKEQLGQWREQWAHLANRHLERHGHAARIDHRSLDAQGIDREATTHLGYAAAEMAARGTQSDRMDALTEIMARNELRFELRLIDGDLAELARLLESERQSGMTPRRPGMFGMEPELPTAAQLQQQADREARELRQLQIQEQQARAAIERQQHEEVLARADAFHRARDAEAEEAKKKQAEQAAAEDRKAREGDIGSATARYAIALGENYTVRDPYGSLARAAMSESAMFHRSQEKMRQEMAKEADPDKRRVIELRMTIEGCDYMALTSDRLAGISLAITGQLNSPQATADRERAAGYRDMAAALRTERSALIEAVQTRDVSAKAPAEADRQPPANNPAQPAPQAAPERMRNLERLSGIEGDGRQSPVRHPDIKAAQAAVESVPPPVPASRAPEAPAPSIERVPAPEPTRKAEMTGTWRPGVRPVRAEAARPVEATASAPKAEPRKESETLETARTSPRAALSSARDIRVADGPVRPPVPLEAFMRDHPRADPEPQRPVNLRAFAADAQARKAQQLARFDELRRSQDAAKAIERIGKALSEGEAVPADDLRSLTREQWDRVGRKGSEGLRELVKEHQNTQSQGRGERTRDS